MPSTAKPAHQPAKPTKPAAAADPSDLQYTFGPHYQHILHKQTLYQQHIAQLTQQLLDLQSQYDAQASQLQQHSETSEKQKAEIAQLQQLHHTAHTLEQLQHTNTTLQQQYSEAQQQIHSLNAALLQQNQQINAMAAQLASTQDKGRIDKLNRRVTQLQTHNQQHQSKIDKLQHTVDVLKAALQSKDRQLALKAADSKHAEQYINALAALLQQNGIAVPPRSERSEFSADSRAKKTGVTAEELQRSLILPVEKHVEVADKYVAEEKRAETMFDTSDDEFESHSGHHITAAEISSIINNTVIGSPVRSSDGGSVLQRLNSPTLHSKSAARVVPGSQPALQHTAQPSTAAATAGAGDSGDLQQLVMLLQHRQDETDQTLIVLRKAYNELSVRYKNTVADRDSKQKLVAQLQQQNQALYGQLNGQGTDVTVESVRIAHNQALAV